MIVSHLTNYNKKKRIPVIFRIYNEDEENTCRKSEVHMKKRSDFSYISHVYYIYITCTVAQVSCNTIYPLDMRISKYKRAGESGDCSDIEGNWRESRRLITWWNDI